jgi:glycosyltransferase involved in cell wall biosynthesis
VLWFGTYSKGEGYPRNTVLIRALREVGVEVKECHAPLFAGAAEKVAAASTGRGLLRFGARAAGAWARLVPRFFGAGPRDVGVVGYTGHLDLYLARALSSAWRRPLVLDAFLSPYDTVVGDRGLLDRESWPARALFALERTALRLSDLVLTDTRAHAAYMAQTFGLPVRRFLPVPVGSLVERRVRVPVPVSGGGDERRQFTAFFCGSFVPLQGVPYILDAAERAHDLRFEILGDGPGAQAVEEEIRRRGMDHVILQRRFVPREEMERRLARADAVLGVFGRSQKALRVVPCKVYDGLAAGLPVVTGDGSGPRELLEDGRNALLVDREDPRSLVRALRRIRDDDRLADRLREGARELARRRFGSKAIGLRLKAALSGLVQPR